MLKDNIKIYRLLKDKMSIILIKNGTGRFGSKSGLMGRAKYNTSIHMLCL